MEKLDLKDRKILYHLDLNSRQSFAQLGRKVGLHKDVVAYRVKRLQEKGIIGFFKTEFNEYKLGYSYLRYYFTFQYITPKIKKEIIEYFIKNKYTIDVHSLEGSYDFTILVAVKNIPNFYYTWDKIFNKYRDYFAKQVFSIICETTLYKYSFLLDKTDEEDRIICKRFDDGKKVELDDFDYKLIKLLDKNARMPTIEIADKLNSTTTKINNRINKLLKSNVITAFRVHIEFPKIGYQIYKADIILMDRNKNQKIINYIQENPNFFMIIKSLGYVDLEFFFYLKNANQLHQIMEDLSIKFPNAIKSYTYFSFTKSHKWVYIPEND